MACAHMAHKKGGLQLEDDPLILHYMALTSTTTNSAIKEVLNEAQSTEVRALDEREFMTIRKEI